MVVKIQAEKKQEGEELSEKLIKCLKHILIDVNKQLLPISKRGGSKPMMISMEPKGDFFLKLPFSGRDVYLTLECSDKTISMLLFKYFLDKLYNEIIPYISHLQFVSHIINDTVAFKEGVLRNAVDNLEEDIKNAYGVDFSAIDHLSLMQYERESDCCRILFGRNVSSSDIEKVCSVMLSKEKQFPIGSEGMISSLEIKPIKFEVNNSKYIRKLIAGGGNGELCLTFNKPNLKSTPVFCGYANVNEVKKYSDIFPIEIIIKKSLEHTLYFKNARVYNKSNEEYTVKKDSDGIDEVINDVKKLNNGIKCEEKIRKVLTVLRSQQHGTSVIFISENDCSNVAKRLSILESAGRALSVAGDEIENLKHLSRMDGAIVVQVGDNCRILLINVILDGLCVSEGEPARGARYNVVANFVKGLNKEGKIEVVGAVLSSDESKFEAIV